MVSPRIILITGANSGIGYATSKIIASASKDCHVIMASRSPGKVQQALEQLRSETEGLKGSLSTLELDVVNPTTVDAAYKEVEAKYGRLDALVNNAGIASPDANFLTQLRNDLDVNVVGAARVSETFKPLLSRSTNPYLIHTASMTGSTNLYSTADRADYKSYRISKAAILMLALGDFKEAKAQNSPVKVFAACPGFVVSNLRGTSELQRSGWGHADDPEDAGRMILDVIEGKRDADVGKFIHKDGVYPW